VSSKSVDKKPILDLLAEFKAEIINEVEEEIEDEVRTQDPDPEDRDIIRSGQWATKKNPSFWKYHALKIWLFSSGRAGGCIKVKKLYCFC
jgi:hypothetical protein